MVIVVLSLEAKDDGLDSSTSARSLGTTHVLCFIIILQWMP